MLHADRGLGGYFYFLYLYDPATGRVTAKPPALYGKWARRRDPLLVKPYVSVADLRGDGHRQIVFEERVHNGTVYNGAVYSYFDIGPELELTRVLALETRVEDAVKPANSIFRRLTRISSKRQRLDVYYGSADGPRLNVGRAILESAGPGQPFHVVDRIPAAEPVLKSLLWTSNQEMPVTVSEEEDDKFLRNGYTLYY